MAGASPPGPKDPIRKPTATKDQTLPVTPGQGAGPTGATAGGPAAAAAAAAASGPRIKIEALKEDKDGKPATDGNPMWSISDENPPKMPVIKVTASITGITTGADPTPATEFEWTAEVKYDSGKTPNGVAHEWKKAHLKAGDTRKIPAITAKGKVTGGNIVINSFPKIRGGDLVITVTAKVGNHSLTSKTKGWRIQGTNPTKDAVADAMPDDTMRKIACVESKMMQFFQAPHEGGALYPYFSEDCFLGVGICQLTWPQPTDDQFWDWTENVKGGIALYNDKKLQARGYPARVARSVKFLDLERKYNKVLEDQALASPSATACKQVKVKVPEFTADQLEDDTIRGFNGWGGDDGFLIHPKELHEFRIQVDKAGALVVDGDPTTGTVNAKWERVPADQRPGFAALPTKLQEGVKHYVESVKKRNPRTCVGT